MIRKKIKKILVPLDGSKNSLRGLDEAIYLARQCQATITGLYVIPIYPRNLADAIMPFQIHLSKEAKKFMEEAKTKSATKGIVFKSKIIFGSPTVEIEELSRKGKFNIIVIGSRGQSGLKEAFLGSVANAIVHKSKIPVLVVK
ncbi:MAG: universal stress protein [Nitrosopumilaceae archaeon]|uniref:Universal stress protein n=2 Tax=Candidatus Nitrosomaritimum aestuariumsis TaxID=3342354 RepID=A0AC60W382_9ARCH|nr:universal stress protein [Nitrosopumilaceae archaeon]MBA4454089.1 universal stress protein [Nitrosopumilaceae archaeon]MBA4459642.1 universal stress protein [Nitrosopumilaceae archaeon]